MHSGPAGFQPRSLRLGGAAHLYAVYLPPQYDESRAWPVVLFLHGAGERGSDGLIQTTVGIGPALVKRPDPLQAVVVLPQCPRTDHWTVGGRAIAMAALDETEREFRTDRKRVSLTGISMGGAGAWVVASDNPARFSALAPVCGWVTGRKLPETISHIPTWIFHGTDDVIVPVTSSRAAADTLRSFGADVQYTELPGVGHNSWDPAYQDSGLLDWLVSARGQKALE